MKSTKLYLKGSIQQLYLHGDAGDKFYVVSTGLKGFGECEGSEQTPRGLHRICAKFGAGMAENTVFVGRQATGEVYSAELAEQQPQRDWILTRILWLEGLEPGKNAGGALDTRLRFIYIHGTPDSEPMGLARSHGCIRMRNRDIIDLFDQVVVGDTILIEE